MRNRRLDVAHAFLRAVSPFVATLRQTAASAQAGIWGGALIVVQQPDLQ